LYYLVKCGVVAFVAAWPGAIDRSENGTAEVFPKSTSHAGNKKRVDCIGEERKTDSEDSGSDALADRFSEGCQNPFTRWLGGRIRTGEGLEKGFRFAYDPVVSITSPPVSSWSSSQSSGTGTAQTPRTSP